MNEPSLLLAFVWGALSFLAPCIFPLVPGIIGYVSYHGTSQPKISVISRTILFTFGFSSIFISSGTLVGFLGFHLRADIPWLDEVAGAVLIIFGLQMIGVLRMRMLYRQWSAPWPAIKKFGWFAPVLVGMAFGLGWSPCIGPILGGILTMAYVSETALRGTFLLGIYSVGLALPFIVSAVFVERLTLFIRKKKIGRLLALLEKISGALLVAIGILILTDTLILLNNYFEFLNFFEKL